MLEELLGGVLGEELEDVGEREAVLLGEGDVDAVVGGGGLQLEVEAAAEALAQREAPGLVDAAAEGSVQDELHAAAFVEEALGDDGGLGGDGAEDGAAGDDVGDELERAAEAQMPQVFALSQSMAGGDSRDCAGDRDREPGETLAVRAAISLAEFADAVGEDGGALRGFAEPEGQAGRGAVGVFDQHAAGGFDALDAPTGVAEQDDVAGGGVDGEVLVERGDLYAFRLQDDVEEGGVGDGAAVGDGDACGSRGAGGAGRGRRRGGGRRRSGRGWIRCLREEGDELVEELAGEVAVGVGAAEDVVEGVFVPGLGADSRRRSAA